MKRSRIPLIVALMLHAVLGLALIATVPLAQAPDEAAHWQYVEYLAQRHAIPVFTGAVPPAPGYEFHQPPLYYALCAPLWAATGAGVQNYACRLVALVFTLLTVLLVWQAANTIWPQRNDLPAVATGFAALWPVHLGVGASSNNDSLAGFWCAAMFVLMARGSLGSWSRRDQALAGLCAALGLWTKDTTLVVTLALLVCAWQLDRRAKRSQLDGGLTGFSPGASHSLLVVAGVALVVAAPLLVRNTLIYGDPLAMGAFAAAATAGTPGYPLFAANGIGFIQYWRGMLLCIFATFWGFWGGPNSAVRMLVPLNPRTPDPSLLILMLGFVGAKVVCLLGFLRLVGDGRQEGPTAEQRLLLWCWGVGSGLIVLAWLQFAYQHFSGGQARYLHGFLVPLVIFGAMCWTRFWGRGRARLLATTGFALLLLLMNLLNILQWKTLV